MPSVGRIKASDVDAVRERTDIVQLISEYVPLKKTGREFRGPCPFHQERDPSFYVNPAKGVYHCFGCKASGGVFNFVMQLEGLNFQEAVERLADRIGYRVSYEKAGPDDVRERSLRDRLLKLNRTAADYFQYVLKDTEAGAPALEYLASRGFGPEVVDEFQLGLAPGSWDALCGFLAKKGYSERELVVAGLARERSGGRGVYDVFRSRIMFPIHDQRGRVVAFGGRRLSDAAGDEPKYINSPETPVYRKSTTLYGYHQARNYIQEAGRAVVVEGYTDLLALWKAGCRAVVATLGTALTEGHFDLVSRFCEKVYIAFDADRAGVEAAQRPVEFFGRFKVDVFVVTLPGGEDPASLVEKKGIDTFNLLKEKAEPLLEFSVRKTIERHDTSTTMGRRRAMEACVPILSRVSTEDMRPIRDELVRMIGGMLDMPEPTVLHYAREAARSARRTRSGSRAEHAPPPAIWEKVEREALRVLLHHPGTLLEHPYLDGDYFSSEDYRKIFEMLKEIVAGGEEDLGADYDGVTGRLVESIEQEELRGIATRLLVESPPGSDAGSESEVFNRLSYAYFKNQKRKKEYELSRVNRELEPKKYEAICNQLLELDLVIKEQFPYDHG